MVVLKKSKGEIIMELMDDAGMMDEKNLEYFRRVVREVESSEFQVPRDEKGVSYERKDNEKSF